MMFFVEAGCVFGFNKHTPWKIKGWKPRMEVEDSDDLPDFEHFMAFLGVADCSR